ncbi:DUF2507 domain-containing protein [Lacticaseibacillus mingshuiensis]|uniref:DUF2507 domain-containing protein n=1 Tax=Lacticaseibacillus mingshuiensis TaxID=2799574 RepID=A0ABW4CGE5_9LACO|nr:DUF2507 domain-containing protein [Lacticaseibacillus mingshuiensis]
MPNQASYPELLNLPAESPLFGQLMLRDLLLPELLGDEDTMIAYWAGRAMARRLPVEEEALPELFTRLGLGDLKAAAAKRKSRTYLLSGTIVETRLKHFSTPDFRFEAGFLAQSLQQVMGIVVEANAESDPKLKQVTVTVALDPTTPQPIAKTFYSLT